jgi:hypothetical protein
MNYKVGDKLSDEDIEYIWKNRHLNYYVEKYIRDKNFFEFRYEDDHRYFIVYNNEIIYQLEEFLDYDVMLDGKKEPLGVYYINGKRVEAGEYLRMASVDYVIKKYYEEKA